MNPSVCKFILLGFFLNSTKSGFLHAGIINKDLDPVFAKIEELTAAARENNAQVSLCLKSIPKNTRYFLYRRFAAYALWESDNTQAKLEETFGIMAYLACRESSGRVVAVVPHRKEREKGSCHYGSSYAVLKNALVMAVKKRTATGVASYFDHETNAGTYQVSADQVDDIPHPKDKHMEVHKYFVNRVLELNSYSTSQQLKECGTHEYFDVQKEKDVPKALSESVEWISKYVERAQKSAVTWFRQVDELVWYHQLQSLCPDLNLELGKMTHYFHEGGYYGPKNNTHNWESCGKSFSLCRPIYENISASLNTLPRSK